MAHCQTKSKNEKKRKHEMSKILFTVDDECILVPLDDDGAAGGGGGG